MWTVAAASPGDTGASEAFRYGMKAPTHGTKKNACHQLPLPVGNEYHPFVTIVQPVYPARRPIWRRSRRDFVIRRHVLDRTVRYLRFTLHRFGTTCRLQNRYSRER